MALRNTRDDYGSVARWLHWLAVIGIFALVGLGLYFDDLPRGEAKTGWMALHMSIGVVVLALMVVRLGWRLVNPRPDDPPGVPAWQGLTARVAHWLIYALVFFQLGTGIMVRATVGAIPFFGLFEITLPIERNRELHRWFEDQHILGWQLLLIVVAVHVAAALYHHAVRKDTVLKRMTTGLDQRD